MMNGSPRLKPFLVFAAGWFVPGLGHFLIGRKVKAFVFFGAIALMVGLGLAMHGGFTPLSGFEPLTVLSFLGGLGNGALYFGGRLAGAGAGNMWAATYQYGTAYVTAAGFMNLLIALNAAVAAGKPGAGKEAGHV